MKNKTYNGINETIISKENENQQIKWNNEKKGNTCMYHWMLVIKRKKDCATLLWSYYYHHDYWTEDEHPLKIRWKHKVKNCVCQSSSGLNWFDEHSHKHIHTFTYTLGKKSNINKGEKKTKKKYMHTFSERKRRKKVEMRWTRNSKQHLPMYRKQKRNEK